VKFLGGLDAGFEVFSVSERYEPAEDVLDRAFRWIEETGTESPTFVWIHLYDVHEWRTPRNLDRPRVRWVREKANLQKGELRAWLRANHGMPSDLGELGPSILQAINRYDGQLYAVDRALESFFENLGVLGDFNDAMWIITSDHGEGLGNHHHLGHGQYIYEEQIRVPLLVHSVNGRFEPSRVESMVRLVDVAPTIADLVGVDMTEQPIAVEGQSFASLLRDPRASWIVTEAFAQRRPLDQRRIDMGWTPGEVYATRSLERKLIVNSEGPCELFDLSADPFEADNLCDSTDPDIAALIEILGDRYSLMQSQSEAVRSGVASPEVIEELKALGYL
jgi:arylsulfatase A-like enzyme